jgi:hypothetical protein
MADTRYEFEHCGAYFKNSQGLGAHKDACNHAKATAVEWAGALNHVSMADSIHDATNSGNEIVADEETDDFIH